jgi:hypothetical protein
MQSAQILKTTPYNSMRESLQKTRLKKLHRYREILTSSQPRNFTERLTTPGNGTYTSFNQKKILLMTVSSSGNLIINNEVTCVDWGAKAKIQNF